MIIEEVKLLIITLLLVYVIIISLRPSSPNPKFMFILHKNPILLIVLFIMAIYSFYLDERIGFLLLIIIFGIYFDITCIIKRNVTNRSSVSNIHYDDSNR